MPDDLLTRLTQTAEAIAALRVETEDECETRDRLVLEAIDAGYGRSQVAAAARVTTTRVTQIVAQQAAVPA